MRKPWYSIFYIKSPIAKIGLAILALLLSLVIVIVQYLIEEPRMTAQANSWNGRSVEIGASLFSSNCSSCHGPDGKGGAGPALQSRYFFSQRLKDVGFAGTLEQYVALTLHAGRPSKTRSQWATMMPTWGSTFGGPLRGDQIEHITKYVMNYQAAALEQTPEEDPWQFFQDALAKELPYAPDEPGYEAKVQQAIAAAEAAGAVGYTIAGAAAQAPAADAEPTGPRDPETLFAAMACVSCHNLNAPQTDDSRGPAVGPNLGNLPANAAARVAGQDAATYVHNSIVNPNEFVVEGYMGNIMPQDLASKMSEEEIQGLVAWLLDR